MRNPGGWACVSSPDGTRDYNTFTCGHCNLIVIVRSKQDPANLGGLCKACMALICPRCVAKGTCTPFEKQLEAWEAKEIALRSYGV